MSEKSGPTGDLRVALVGPCASGKSTLKSALAKQGFQVRHVAQEHSYVPHMWQRISRPDVLIYLDIDYATTVARRPRTDGGPERLAEQRRRLAHAREHCDFYLDTSTLDKASVQAAVLTFLETKYGLTPE